MFKKLFCLVFCVLMVALVNDVEAGDLQKEFRGIKWMTSDSYFKSSEEFKVIEGYNCCYWEKSNENLSLGELPLINITYFTGNSYETGAEKKIRNKFYKVVLTFNKDDFQNMKNFLHDKFGDETNSNATLEYKGILWELDEVDIYIQNKYDSSVNSLLIQYTGYKPEVKQDTGGTF